MWHLQALNNNAPAECPRAFGLYSSNLILIVFMLCITETLSNITVIIMMILEHGNLSVLLSHIEKKYKEENTMIKKSIRKHTRFLTCLVALAVVCATFLAGTFTTQAGVDVFGDIELKVGDTLGFVYYTSQPYTETTTMRFTVNGRTSESKAYSNDGKCVFIFNDIYPHELAKDVTATILVDGQEIVSSTGVSIKSFLLQMLMDPQSSEQERQFASDALQYGEQTRLYRNANIDVADRDDISITDDINTSIYGNYKPHDIDSDSDFIGSAEGLGVSASNIRLTSIGIAYHNTNSYVVTLQVPVNSNVDLTKITVKIGDTEYTSTSFKAKGNGQYEVQSMPINAYDIMEGTHPHTTQFSLYVNGKVVQQASYNVLDYIYQLQEATQSGSLALKYARALYRYGQSAENAYKGKRVVSVALTENPEQIVPNDDQPKTPTGGTITAYYSDGTDMEIHGGIKWSNKDIYGNEVKIVDDTHLQQFTVYGTYTDDISDKTFTITGSVELHNDMESAVRHTDPDILNTEDEEYTFSTSYTPTGSELLCTWSNGYTSVRSASCKYIIMSRYQYDEYGFFPIVASYTDPKSNETRTATVYLLYQNPIKSITLEDTTADFNDGTLDNTTKPHNSTYTITYQNNRTQSAKSTDSQSWTNDIQAGDTTTKAQYTFAWNNLVYNGYEIDLDLTATGALTCPEFGTWERMESGNTTPYTMQSRTIKGECIAATANGERELVITSAPYVYGGTVTSTVGLSGNPSSNTNGQLTGGEVYMHYYNNAMEALSPSQVCYTSATIWDASYSKDVDVQAQYIGKNGRTYTNHITITIYNWMKSIKQGQNAIVNAAASSNVNVQVPLSSTENTIEVTYYNGVTEICGTGTAATTSISLAGETRTNWYVANVTEASITDAIRTTATAAPTGTPEYNIVLTYTDYRQGANYDVNKKTQSISNYQVAVRNDAISFVPNQVKTCIMQASTGSTITPTGSVQVNLTNGKKISVIPTYDSVNTISTAKETETRTSDISYTSSLNTTITGSVNVTVANPIISVARYTDPENISIKKTTAITSSDLQGCVLAVTYTNGQSGTKPANVYSNLSNALISDDTRIKQYTIKAGYESHYSKPSQVDVNVILLNPPTSASLSLQSCTQGAPGILNNTGIKPTGIATVTFSNGFKKDYSNEVQTIYKSGTTSSTSDATAKENGTCNVTANLTVPAGAAAYQRLVNNTNAEEARQNAAPMTTSITTAYWINNPSSISVVSVSCSVGHWEKCSSVTPTAKVNVTYTNGKTAERSATKCDPVANIRDYTPEVTHNSKAYYKANEITESCDISVTLINAVTSYTVEKIDETFAGSTTYTAYISGTATYANSKTKVVAAECVTTDNNAFTDNQNGNSVSTTHKEASLLVLKANCTATYNDCEAQFELNVTNDAKELLAYTNKGRTTAAPSQYDTDLKKQENYPQFGYYKNETTIKATKNMYFLLTYDNGVTRNLEWNQVAYVTNPGHSKNYRYANSQDSWSSASLKKYKARFPKTDESADKQRNVTVEFVGTPVAYYITNRTTIQYTEAKNTTSSATAPTLAVSPTRITLTYEHNRTRVLSNTKTRNETSTSNTVHPDRWRYGSTNAGGGGLGTAQTATFSSSWFSTERTFTSSGSTFLMCRTQIDNKNVYAMFKYIPCNGTTSDVWASMSSDKLEFTTGTCEILNSPDAKPFS